MKAVTAWPSGMVFPNSSHINSVASSRPFHNTARPGAGHGIDLLAGIVLHHDPRLGFEGVPDFGDLKRFLQLDRDGFAVAGERRDSHRGRRDPEVGKIQDLSGFEDDFLLFARVSVVPESPDVRDAIESDLMSEGFGRPGLAIRIAIQ